MLLLVSDIFIFDSNLYSSVYVIGLTYYDYITQATLLIAHDTDWIVYMLLSYGRHMAGCGLRQQTNTFFLNLCE